MFIVVLCSLSRCTSCCPSDEYHFRCLCGLARPPATGAAIAAAAASFASATTSSSSADEHGCGHPIFESRSASRVADMFLQHVASREHGAQWTLDITRGEDSRVVFSDRRSPEQRRFDDSQHRSAVRPCVGLPVRQQDVEFVATHAGSDPHMMREYHANRHLFSSPLCAQFRKWYFDEGIHGENKLVPIDARAGILMRFCFIARPCSGFFDW